MRVYEVNTKDYSIDFLLNIALESMNTLIHLEP